jgi:hypothetical protein
MKLVSSKAEVEIVVASGALRVSICPRPTLGLLLTTAGLIVAFVAISAHSWWQSPTLVRIGEAIAVLGAVVAWFAQLSGSEEQIEIGQQGIRISRDILGWNSVSEFPIEQCSDLDVQSDSERSGRLQFRFGKWRTIEFGNHISNEQAEKVLDALADSLPEIARQLLPSLDITKHWTTLDLN